MSEKELEELEQTEETQEDQDVQEEIEVGEVERLDATNPDVIDIDLNNEMRNSFLSYAMSVIVAIPTAIPVAPLTKRFGYLAGKINGSCSLPS